MSDMIYLFAALAFIWTGVLVYVIRLAVLRKNLEKRVENLQQRLDKMENLP